MDSSNQHLFAEDCYIQNSNQENGMYFEVRRKKNELLEQHQKKIDKIEVRLEKIKRLSEEDNKLDLLQAEERTLKELTDQRKEFVHFSDNILEILQFIDDGVTEVFIANEFALECKRFESALPIYSKKSEILDTISKHQVIIITAETGSGKSTQIVQYIHQQYGNQMIVCTQPRKVAAISLAKRVSEEMESSVGKTVGYCVGASSMKTEETSILFVTDHLLLNECLTDRNLSQYKCIIVDEAHERSISTDLLLAMLKKALNYRPELRLIISSATIDPKVFTTYFGERTACIHVHGRTFPVEVIYQDTPVGSDYLQESVLKTKHIHETEGPGDILIFLTTPAETEKAQEMVKNSLESSIHCLILHGRLPPEEQQLVFEPTPPGKRKIVFATNSAETSITIPNIRYVVDSGMVKEKHYDKERNISLLRVGPVNKSSAIQRKGRAGRTQEGKCFRLYTEEEYEEMVDEMLPEILRENLGIALLKLYQFGIEDPLNYDFVQPPEKKSLLLAQDELKDLDALEFEKLTRYGKIMAATGVEPKLAKFVALAVDDGLAMEAMIAAAVCSMGSSVFFRAGSEEEKQTADLLKVHFCKEDGDMITMIEVYKKWCSIDDKKKKSWCFQYSMNGKTLRYTREMVSDMVNNIQKLLQINIDTSFADIDKVRRRIPQLLSECFTKNVGFFSGHIRGGYYIPNKGKERFHLHPSAALSYLNITPKWLLFTEVLCTSRTYIINTSVLPEHIGEALFGKIDVPRINRQKEWVVGKATAKQLGFGRWVSLLEEEMQQNISENIYIEFDNNIGEVKLYSQNYEANQAISMLNEAIRKEQLKFDRKLYTVSLSDGNSTSVVLQKGGVCNEILEHGEFNSILLCKVDEEVTKNDVEEIFEKFGDLSEVIQFKPGNHTWGKVIYQNSRFAAKAVKEFNDRNGKLKEAYVKPAWRIEQCRQYQQKHIVQARWGRTQTKGIAFIEFEDPEILVEFVDQVKNVGNYLYTCLKAKNGNDLMVKGISIYASNEEIKCQFEEHFPHAKIKRCSVPHKPKDIESKDELRAIQRQFSLKIGREIGQEFQDSRKFSLQFLQIKSPKTHDYEVSIHFENKEDAETIVNCKIMMGRMENIPVRFQLETKSPALCVCKEVYYAIEKDLKRMITQDTKIIISEKDNRTKGNPSNQLLIELESKDSESLSEAKTILYDLALGERMKFTEEQFRYFLTPRGREFLATLKTDGSFFIKMDRRVRSLMLFGTTHTRQWLEKTIGMKDEVNRPYEEMWSLDISAQPNGFIKSLTREYGVQLSHLYDETAADYINIDFLHQQLQIYGSNDSIKKAKAVLERFCANLNSIGSSASSIRTLECPICFDTLETSSYQLETCSHSYCKECIQSMCIHGTKNKQLPLKCAKEGCEKDISIENILDLTEIEDIVPAAVELFVSNNIEQYRYCITPGCLNIYGVSNYPNPDSYECQMCQAMICTYCHVKFHYNGQCSRDQEDDFIKKWLHEPDTDRGACPNCSAPIERIDGCNHICCILCGKHFCWRCKKVWFENADDCYKHLEEVCLGIFG